MQTWINWWHRKLLNINEDQIKDFSFDGMKFIAKVVGVYDGDSITVIFKFNRRYQKFKIRMDGYDTPEIRTKDLVEKEYAIKAQNALQILVLGKLVKLECGKSDKYGRILGKVFTMNNIDVNGYMVQNRFGYKYDGGTKVKFDQLHEYYNINK